MTGLLDLPREVRDAIIEHVLLSEHKFEECTSAPLQHLHDVNYMSWTGRERVVYDPQVQQPNAAAIIRLNKQLNAETKEALNRLHRNGPSVLIDLVFFKERELRPHWTLVPVLATNLDTVNVSVHINGHMNETQGYYGRNLWLPGDASPPRILWTFFAALERLMKAGPVGLTMSQNAHDAALAAADKFPDKFQVRKNPEHFGLIDRHITIRHLILNFVTPADPNKLAEATKDSQRAWWHSRYDLNDYIDIYELPSEDRKQMNKVCRPEWLADYLRRYLPIILSITAHRGNWGHFLYGRLGVISFMVDGHLLEKFDLAELLSKLVFPPLPPAPVWWPWAMKMYAIKRELEKAAFDIWKADTYLQRQKIGLPVLPFEKNVLKDMGRNTQPALNNSPTRPGRPRSSSWPRWTPRTTFCQQSSERRTGKFAVYFQ